MSFLVISSSLNPMSLSRLMAQEALARFEEHGIEPTLLDLRETALPFCDADTCYDDPAVKRATELVAEAQGIILATPVYNYNVSSLAKNLVELTGSAWTEKVVGFLCAAGGQTSYMAPMSLANSLMLDYRCLIVPRFVYATENAFENGRIQDDRIHGRIGDLIAMTIRITRAVHGAPSPADGGI